MKKVYLLLMFFTLLVVNNENITAQQVNKNYVVVEIGTGTWCPYCPGAAMGADDLVENGHLVAVVENHNGDPYANTGSNARNSYYGITNYPTALFNGGYAVIGGSSSNSMYSTYLTKYNQAMAVMSDFTLDLTYTHTGPDYEANIVIDEPGDYTGTNLKVHLILTESHIPENWQGMTELNFVSRSMYPNPVGTSYTGGTTTLNLSFTADSGWDLSNCELVAFIQDNSTKEILQADKISLAEPTGTNNIAIMNVEEIPTTCDYLISPSLNVKNYGSADITSLTIDYSINSGNTTGTRNWSGEPISMFDQKIITLDDLQFSELNDTNPIDFEITHVNGVTDDDTSNNTASSSFEEATETANDYVEVFIVTDNNGDELTWNIKDSTDTIVESGGPYGNNETILVSYSLIEDCYTFSVFDAGGNGGSLVIVADENSNPVYYSPGDHGAGESQEFIVPNAQGVDDMAFAESHIYPNPAKTELTIENAEGLHINLYDVLGREVIVKNNISVKEQLDITNLSEGTYILKMSDGKQNRIEKIVITR